MTTAHQQKWRDKRKNKPAHGEQVLAAPHSRQSDH